MADYYDFDDDDDDLIDEEFSDENEIDDVDEAAALAYVCQ